MSGRTSARGFSLIELVISITVLTLVLSGALAFMARENTAFQTATRRLGAVRNLRYAMAAVEQDLRTVGINVPPGQPVLVYVGSSVVAFTADYATNVSQDPFAVYTDPDAPTGQVTLPDHPVTIPTTAFTFPDMAYETQPGVGSAAELLVFFIEPDADTDRTDDYRLMRQVNDGSPERVARSLLPTGSTPFFQYLAASDTGLVPLPSSELPLGHTEPLHNSPADTGAVARIDDIRAISFTVSATNGVPGEGEVVVDMMRTVDLPNTGLESLSVCGDEPILGTSPEVAVVTLASGDEAIEVSWDPATDEVMGEEDVVRYVLWRRLHGTAGWGDPYVAIAAGSASYVYTDSAITPGEDYEYGLAAQDCTPSISPVARSPMIGVQP